MTSNLMIRSIIEKCPLEKDGSNFMEWELKICLILRQEDLSYMLEKDNPTQGDNATQEEKTAKEKFRKDEVVVQGIILRSMASKLRKK